MTDIILSNDIPIVLYKAITESIYIQTFHASILGRKNTEYLYNSYNNAAVMYQTITERIFLSMQRVEVFFSLIDERTVTFPEESANVTSSNIETLYQGNKDSFLSSSNMEVCLTQLPDPNTKGRFEIIQQEDLYLAKPKMAMTSTNMEVLIVFPPRRRPIYHPS